MRKQKPRSGDIRKRNIFLLFPKQNEHGDWRWMERVDIIELYNTTFGWVFFDFDDNMTFDWNKKNNLYLTLKEQSLEG